MSNITFLLNLLNSPPLVVAYVLLKIHHIEQNIHPVGQVAPKTQGEQWHQCLWTSRTLVQCHPTFRVSHCTVALRNHWKRVDVFFHPFWWLNWLWWSLGYAVRSLKCACYEVLRLAGSVLTYNSVLDGCVTGLQGSWTKWFGHHLCVFWYIESIIYRIYPISRDPFPARVTRSPLF